MDEHLQEAVVESLEALLLHVVAAPDVALLHLVVEVLLQLPEALVLVAHLPVVVAMVEVVEERMLLLL